MYSVMTEVWAWVGAALLLSTPGQAWLVRTLVNDFLGIPNPTPEPELPAQNVSWCPIADHPSRAFRYPGGKYCYATYTDTLDWEEAVEFCALKGGRLAKLSGSETGSTEMYNRLEARMKGHVCYWIGLSKKDGQWQWLDEIVNTTTESPEESSFSPETLSPTLPTVDYSTTSVHNYLPSLSTEVITTSIPTVYVSTEDITDVDVKEDVTSVPRTGNTTPATVNAPVKTQRRRRRQPKTKNLVTKKISTGTFLSGKPLFHARVFAVTMCARTCTDMKELCQYINYRPDTKECKGFTSAAYTHREDIDGWDLWDTVEGDTVV